MSYIQSTIECEQCKKQMNVAFGIVGRTQIAAWPEKCPDCGSRKLKRIRDGWHAQEIPTNEEIFNAFTTDEPQPTDKKPFKTERLICYYCGRPEHKDFACKQHIDAVANPKNKFEIDIDPTDQKFRALLAKLVCFVEEETSRIDEERRGAHRRDGGRIMTCSAFLNEITSAYRTELEKKVKERWNYPCSCESKNIACLHNYDGMYAVLDLIKNI